MLGGASFFEVVPVLDRFFDVFPLRSFRLPKEEEDVGPVFFPVVDPVTWAIAYSQFVEGEVVLGHNGFGMPGRRLLIRPALDPAAHLFIVGQTKDLTTGREIGLP